MDMGWKLVEELHRSLQKAGHRQNLKKKDFPCLLHILYISVLVWLQSRQPLKVAGETNSGRTQSAERIFVCTPFLGLIQQI